VQHLLLRFGIIGSLRRRSVKYAGGRRIAWQLDITDAQSIRVLLREIGIFGKEGLENLAKVNISRARKLQKMIGQLDDFDSPFFDAYHFNEFVIRTPVRPEKLNKLLLRNGIIGGLPLHGHLRQLEDHMLICTTELHSDQDYERLVSALREVQ
jgi:glycine cleavage system pyridoxal-binding protein P